jgi:U3 small nucleolar RNA-associated protein 5
MPDWDSMIADHVIMSHESHLPFAKKLRRNRKALWVTIRIQPHHSNLFRQMSASKKQKTTRKRPPTGRPLATTTISQPTVEDAAKQTIQCSFSPDGGLFAFLMLAVDKHRLRIYDTHTSQSVAEYIFESGEATSLKWANIDLSMSEDADNQPSTKKRRMKDINAAEGFVGNDFGRIVVLGTSDGAVLLFSPLHGRVIRKLSHPSSNAAVLSVAVHGTDIQTTIWASGADSAVRIWDIQSGNILSQWKNEERIPYTCLSPRPAALDTEEQQVLVAHHSIQLFSSSARYSKTSRPEQLASFIGHASQVKNLEWDTSQSPSERFYSSAEGDRFIYMWQIPREGSTEGKTLLSIPLESAVDTFMQLSGTGGLRFVTLSVSGKVSFFHISDDVSTLSTPASSDSRLGRKVPTIVPQSQISQTGEPTAKIVGISSIPGQQGYIRISRLIKGIRPVFDDVVRKAYSCIAKY